MLTKINMPDGGQNTDQLLVVAWKKQVGDPVKRGDILLEVETDKAVLEVESFAEGTLLAQAVAEGSYGTAGEVIAYIGSPEDMKDLEKSSRPSSTETAGSDDFTPIMAPRSAPQSPGESGTDTMGGALKATPAAKKRARERAVDLVEVARHAGKQILHAADIDQFSSPRAIEPSRAVTTPAPANGAATYELIPLTAMRRTIAERMEQAAAVPTFTAEVEVNMAACIRMRNELNQFSDAVKVSYHDIIGKCVALAVQSYPLVNASFTDSGIRVFREVNIGLAVSVEQGLIVPVVRDVRAKGIADLARENAENIALVRSGKFDPRLTENGTFTISNLGKYPVSRFTAILNPPQSSILAIGSIRSRVIWEAGQCHECPTASLTGTFDHRVVDGAYGAAFLTRLKELLEHLTLLLL